LIQDLSKVSMNNEAFLQTDWQNDYVEAAGENPDFLTA
jgi:hypothetical protein